MDLAAQVEALPVEAILRLEKIVVHANCPDGIASAIILHHALPRLPVEFVVHGTPEHNQEPCRALFCDFSPPAERAQAWVDADAIVLDHHATARPVVELFGNAGVFADEMTDPGVSGALLAYLFAERLGRATHPMLEFAELVGVRDTWRRSHPDWEEACHLSSALTFFGADFWLKSGLPDRGHIEAGRVVYEKRLKKAAETAAVLQPQSFQGVRFGLFNDSAEKLTSDVGEAARANGRELDFVAGYFVTNDETLVVSMRSVADGFDVGAIAKANGGGGHTKAAGFQVADGLERAPLDAVHVAIARTLRGRA